MDTAKFHLRGADVWDLLRALVADPTEDRILIAGPPGIGKTFLFLTGQPTEPVTVACNEGMLANEFYGGRMPHAEGGGTSMVWQDGPALVAVRQDRPLLANEVDKSSEDVLEVMYALADEPESRRLTVETEGGVEVVPVGAGFRFFATSNVLWNRLPEALANRFTKVWVDEPAPEALATLPEDLREACRALAGHPDPKVRTGLRDFARFARYRDKFDLALAGFLAFGERAEEFTDAASLKALVRHAEQTKSE